MTTTECSKFVFIPCSDDLTTYAVCLCCVCSKLLRYESWHLSYTWTQYLYLYYIYKTLSHISCEITRTPEQAIVTNYISWASYWWAGKPVGRLKKGWRTKMGRPALAGNYNSPFSIWSWIFSLSLLSLYPFWTRNASTNAAASLSDMPLLEAMPLIES